MAEYTENFNLKKPGQDDFYNIEDFNENADIIDSELKKLNDAIKDLDADGITLPDGKTISEKFEEITEEVGNIQELNTDEKANIVAAINEIYQALLTHKQNTNQEIGQVASDLAAHKADYASFKDNTNTELESINNFKADYEYQIVTVVNRQIRVQKLSDTNIVKFRLDEDIEEGEPITISLDNGATELPLLDIDGDPVIELEKGFVEVISDDVNFTLRPRGGIKINSIIEKYKVIDGENISAGDFVKFVNGLSLQKARRDGLSTTNPVPFHEINLDYISATALSDTKVLVAYRGAGGNCTAVIITINGDVITSSQPTYILGFSTTNMNMVTLSDTKVLISFKVQSSSSRVAVLNIDGENITNGIPVVYSNSDYYPGLVKLSSNKALIYFSDGGNSYYGTARVVDIDGDSITLGSNYIFRAANISGASAVALSENKVLMSYTESVNQNGECVVLTISGKTITKGSTTVFSPAVSPTSVPSSTALSSDRVLVAYQGTESSTTLGTTKILNVNENLVDVSTPMVYEYSNIANPQIIALTDSVALITYEPVNLNYGKITSLTINEDVIKLGTSIAFNSALNLTRTTRTQIAKLSDRGALIVFRETMSDSGGRGSAVFVNSVLNANGIAKQSGKGGDEIKIYTL